MRKKLLLISVLCLIVLTLLTIKVKAYEATPFNPSDVYYDMLEDTALVQRLGTADDGSCLDDVAWQKSKLIGRVKRVDSEGAYKVHDSYYIFNIDFDTQYSYFVESNVKAGTALWFKIYYKTGLGGRTDLNDRSDSNIFIEIEGKDLNSTEVLTRGVGENNEKAAYFTWYGHNWETPSCECTIAEHGWDPESLGCYLKVNLNDDLTQELIDKHGVEGFLVIKIYIHGPRWNKNDKDGTKAHVIYLRIKNIQKSDKIVNKENNVKELEEQTEAEERRIAELDELKKKLPAYYSEFQRKIP